MGLKCHWVYHIIILGDAQKLEDVPQSMAASAESDSKPSKLRPWAFDPKNDDNKQWGLGISHVDNQRHPAFFIRASISSMEVSFSAVKVRSTTETSGVGTPGKTGAVVVNRCTVGKYHFSSCAKMRITLLTESMIQYDTVNHLLPVIVNVRIGGSMPSAKTRKAIPVNLPLVVGKTSPTALAAPVALGIMLQDAARPPRQSCGAGDRWCEWMTMKRAHWKTKCNLSRMPVQSTVQSLAETPSTVFWVAV